MEPEQSNHEDGVASLPEDIVLDMLARLPAKELCQFHCVSKAWCSLISEPTFVAAQRSRAGPHLVGMFFRGNRWPPEVRVMDMDGNIVRVLEVRQLGKDDDKDVLGMLQQQATTRLNVILYTGRRIGDTAMIIDPAAGRACTIETYTPESHELTFGRATPSGALKILRLEYTSARQQICTVSTIVDGGAEPLRWRLRSAPPFVTCWYPHRRATINGVIYFMPPRRDDDATSAGLHHIAAFDLESEEWKMINGPALGIQENAPYFALTEHKGTLGFVQSLRESNDVEHYYAIIWLLIDYNKSVWVMECTIQMPRMWELTKQLGALDDGRILLMVGVWKTNNTGYHHRDVLVFYNPSTNTFTEFRDKPIMGFNDILVMYTGSLLS